MFMVLTRGSLCSMFFGGRGGGEQNSVNDREFA